MAITFSWNSVQVGEIEGEELVASTDEFQELWDDFVEHGIVALGPAPIGVGELDPEENVIDGVWHSRDLISFIGRLRQLGFEVNLGGQELEAGGWSPHLVDQS